MHPVAVAVNKVCFSEFLSSVTGLLGVTHTKTSSVLSRSWRKLLKSELTIVLMFAIPFGDLFFEKITVYLWVLPSSHRTAQGGALVVLALPRVLYGHCEPLNYLEFGYVCLRVSR